MFGFAEQQNNATSWLGFQITLKRKSNNVALSQNAGTVNQKIGTKGFGFYVSPYILKVIQHNFLKEQSIAKTSTESSYNRRPVTQKDVQQQDDGVFVSEVAEGTDLRICYGRISTKRQVQQSSSNY